jgi:nucleoid-associated protein YgaU
MTRETRIGLLVGLAFILMFGLVLGDLTGSSSPSVAPPSAGIAEVSNDGWAPLTVPPLPAERSLAASSPLAEDDGTSPQDDGVVETALVPPLPGEGPGSVDVAATAPPAPTAAASAAAPAPKQEIYVVQAKDSLRKVARKVYGPDHESAYRQILEANRNILEDESRLQIGQQLVIPPLEAPAKPQTREMDLDELRKEFSSQRVEQASVKAKGGVYVVRPGDTLSSITRKVLNDSSKTSVQKLYRANQDRLKSPDALPVGLELRIPS